MTHKIPSLILLNLSTLLFFFGCGQQGDAIPYPLDYCLVGGSDLGEMGEPVSYVHEGQEFKFCCKPCIPKFKKNPQKFIDELKEETSQP
jgi:YHS domain-containing protein